MDGYDVLVTNIDGGKGYAPISLIQEGKVAEAARIAKKAWEQRL